LGLDQHDLVKLELPFGEEEVWNTIKHMPDVMAALAAVHCGNFMNLHLLNTALLTLLPKKQDVVQVKDFWPISLIHSFAKLVTKLIANRLSRKLSAVVAANQSAFVKGRCIHDNFILVQQTTKFLHQQKQPWILLKLDISNTPFGCRY